MTKSKNNSRIFSGYSLGRDSLEGVEVLVSLGLSNRQARVYLSLLKLGVARSRVVALLAGVPRQEVYGLLLELQHMGLVRQNLSTPIYHTAEPFSEAVKNLLEQKTHELVMISERAQLIAERLDQPGGFIAIEPPKPCFGEVCEGERGKKYKVAIEQTKHTIDAISSWIRFKQLSYHFETEFKKALKKGVTIQIVTEKPANHQLPKWITQTQIKCPNLKVKTIPTALEAAITIFDKTQLAIAFDPSSRLSKGPDLWTNHPSLVSPYQAYFNTVWSKTELM